MGHIIPTRVRVKASGPYQGQTGEITMIYCDVYHRGGGPDYYHVRLDSGKHIGGLDTHFEPLDPGILLIEPGDLDDASEETAAKESDP